MNTLVIGFGNPLRGDDGVAWHVVDRLDALRPCSVATRRVHQLTPELAEPISAFDFVVFVDAAVDTAPGTVRVERLDRLGTPAPHTHLVDPAGLVNLAELVYGRRPEAVLVTIGGKVFGLTERLSPPARAAVLPAAERICALVNDRRPRGDAVQVD